MEATRVALVDDHRVVRRGLRSYLESFGDISVIGEASTGEEALGKVGEWLPDVVVMDLLMPGGIDGIETTRRLRSISPRTQVVVLTAHSDDTRLFAALRAGAIGYVCKEAAPELLLSAVRAAACGRSMLDPALASSILQDLAATSKVDDPLTERELDVLRMLAHGCTNREIADQLVISQETVKTHVGNILSKLHLAHRTQVVIHALKEGIISLDEIEL